MNDARRKQVRKAKDLVAEAAGMLEEAKDLLSTLADEEREAFDSMPEHLQDTERGAGMAEAADKLEEARDELEDLSLEDLMEKLDEAVQ